MAMLVRIGWGVLLVLGLLLILLHPGMNPVPTLVGSNSPMPILLQLAVVSLLLLYRHTHFLAQWRSQRPGDRKVPYQGTDVSDLICTRLC